MPAFMMPDGMHAVNGKTLDRAGGDASTVALAVELERLPTPALAGQVLTMQAAVGGPLWPLVAPRYHAAAAVLAQRAAESEAA